MKTMENWLPVVGYEGIYSVSDSGNIMAMNYANTGMLRLLTPTKTSGNYWRVSLTKGGEQKTVYVHRIVMAAFVGPRPVGMQINHRNADKKDNRLSNLEYCTASENKRHASQLGLCAHGERNGSAKLTAAQVLSIREEVTNGYRNGAEVARKYGVCKSTVNRILRGKNWVDQGATLFGEPEL